MVRKRQLSEDARRRISEAARKSNRRRWGDPIERFWSHVDKSSGPDNCWPWVAFRDKRGYGTTGWRGRRGLKAHRVAYEIHHGPIEKGLLVIHSCDNPSCCNLAHLRLGTHRDNTRDKVARGRQARGSSNGWAKLHEADIVRIRNLVSSGANQSAVARTFKVAPQTISQIIRGVTWSHFIYRRCKHV